MPTTTCTPGALTRSNFGDPGHLDVAPALCTVFRPCHRGVTAITAGLSPPRHRCVTVVVAPARVGYRCVLRGPLNGDIASNGWLAASCSPATTFPIRLPS